MPHLPTNDIVHIDRVAERPAQRCGFCFSYRVITDHSPNTLALKGSRVLFKHQGSHLNTKIIHSPIDMGLSWQYCIFLQSTPLFIDLPPNRIECPYSDTK